jgi:thymidine phosphorylase
VKAGELLVTVHAPDDDARAADAVARLQAAITVGASQPAEVPLLLERIG